VDAADDEPAGAAGPGGFDPPHATHATEAMTMNGDATSAKRAKSWGRMGAEHTRKAKPRDRGSDGLAAGRDARALAVGRRAIYSTPKRATFAPVVHCPSMPKS
jgi:hypothetical protein